MEKGFNKNFSQAINYSTSYEEAINRCSSFLPGDLIVEILQRLPVKSLLRFKSTSKSWQLVIRNSKFIVKHYTHQKHNNNKEINYIHLYNHPLRNCYNVLQPFSLCNCSSNSGPWAISDGISLISKRDDGHIITHSRSHSPLRVDTQSLSIVGSSNGLVCIKFCCYDISSISRRDFFGWERSYGIWNPATRKFKLLPTPQPSELRKPYSIIVGFSHIPSTCSYKLVQILGSYDHVNYSGRVQVLNMGASSWREIVCQDELFIGLCQTCGRLESSNEYIHNRPVIVKGCLYFVQYGRVSLLSFDLDKEVFTQTALPCPCDDASYVKLAVFEDYLFAFVSKDHIIEKTYDVWIYEGTAGQSWTKKFSFGPLHARAGGRSNKPVGFWADGEIILRSGYLYNPNNNEMKNFPCNEYYNCNFVLEPYVESLVDFNEDK